MQEAEGSYTLGKVKKDGKEIKDEDTYQVTCLNTEAYMAPLLEDGNAGFEKSEKRVKEEWITYIKDGGTIAEPENYITLKETGY